MNHQPFEIWLLEEKQLEPAQQRELDSHLRSCAHCTAIAETGLQLKSVRAAGPAAGFAQRFAVRLAAHRVVERRRRLWGMSIFTVAGVALLGWLGSPIWIGLRNSPAQSIARILDYILFITSSLQAVLDVGRALVQVGPGFVPPFAWMVIASGLAGLSLLWYISIWRLNYVPRGA